MEEIPMKLINYLIIVAVIAFSLPVVSFSAHHTGGGGCTMSSWEMTELDADNDGEISFEEYTAPHTEKLRSGFDMIDSNGDGVVSELEWDELLDAHGVKKYQ